MPLSAVIITRNAAAQLEPCLASVGFADEIVVVDSASTDGTQEIARRHGARVIDRDWRGFGPQKQFAVEAAAHDWVLCVDADERVNEALRSSIAAELARPRARAYALLRRNRFLGRWLRHGEGYPDWVVRLFDRRAARWSDDPVHEKVVSNAPAARLAGELLHESADTLEHYLEKQNRYTTLQAERLRAEGRRAGAWHLVVSPLARFFKFYFLRLGFLDGVPGLVHVAIGCMNSFCKYAKLIERQRTAQ
ncbi:MAG: glycosyltransferase family 2 protein [Betaproteobacteria bacterium]|nr:glycosyltransferase family 2 protein [Betaproteobacteria bacterium]MBI2960985.1 glycosyltransferase family 2 protein [Betaproteobacteria bacterium]